MSFGKTRDEYSVKLAHGVTLVSCPSAHLLGIALDCKLSFTDHILNLCKKSWEISKPQAPFYVWIVKK